MSPRKKEKVTQQSVIPFKPSANRGKNEVKSTISSRTRRVNKVNNDNDYTDGIINTINNNDNDNNNDNGSTRLTPSLVDEISSESDEDDHKFSFNNKKRELVATKPSAKPPTKLKTSLKREPKTIPTPAPKRVKFTKSFTKSLEDSGINFDIPWIIKYAPKKSSEVAIHNKKLTEIKNALLDMDMSGASIARRLYRHRLLIVSGPTSSSKTAIIKTLAQELGYNNILEWHNHDKLDNDVGITQSFDDFLTGAIFGSSNDNGNPNSKGNLKKLVLVEDLPNISHYETKEMFNLALLQWINQPSLTPPLVLIITEYEITEENRRYGRGSRRTTSTSYSSSSYTSDSIIVERILSRKILNDPRVIRIKVPPINTTLMTKTLKRIVSEENDIFSSLPITKSEIDSTIKSLSNENGDLRSAINNLEFYAKYQSQSINTTGLKPITKETTLDLFHAIGRIIHGSHKDSKGVPVSPDPVVVESVLKDWGYNNRDGNFSLAIFENYPGAHKSQMSINSISSIAELLSECDTFIPYNIPTIMSDITFNGVRYKLRHGSLNPKEKPQFRPLVYPREKKVFFKQLELSTEYDNYRTKYSKDHGLTISKPNSILYDGFYESIINNRKQNPTLLTKRLGGKIEPYSSIRPEQNEENEDDLQPTNTNSKDTIALNNNNKNNTEQPLMCITFSDDDIEDSENDS